MKKYMERRKNQKIEKREFGLHNTKKIIYRISIVDKDLI